MIDAMLIRVPFRMGCLLDQRTRLRRRREQAHANTRLRMHCHKWKEWILQVQLELDTREDGQRLRKLDGWEN